MSTKKGDSTRKGDDLKRLAGEGGPLMRDLPDGDDPGESTGASAPRLSRFWRRFGQYWGWAYHHGRST